MNPEQQNTDAIRVRNLTKSYGGNVLALASISFDVRCGEIFGFLGPNGAGKSTTLRILTTLAKPDSGSVRVAGIDVLQHPEEVRRRIGVVAQQSGGDPEATGRENLVLQGQLHNFTGHRLTRRVDELLKRFELSEAADRQVKTYSGGMSRRLDIAMGLLHQPAVLFLDEPTTGLDPESRTDMWRDLALLARDDGVTIFLTTHYMEEADHLANRIAIIDQGQIVATGSPDELKRELQGDTLIVEFSAGSSLPAARQILESLDGISDVLIDGNALRTRAGDDRSVLPRAYQVLESADLRPSAVTVSRPTLDDVYLKHAGRSFRSAEIEQETR